MDEARSTVVTGIEMFRKTLDYAEAGDNIGASAPWYQQDRDRARPGSLQSRAPFIRTPSSVVRFTF